MRSIIFVMTLSTVAAFAKTNARSTARDCAKLPTLNRAELRAEEKISAGKIHSQIEVWAGGKKQAAKNFEISSTAANAGLRRPKEQPFAEHVLLKVAGGHADRIVLIHRSGKPAEFAAGPLFLSKDGKILYAIKHGAASGAAWTAFDLEHMKALVAKEDENAFDGTTLKGVRAKDDLVIARAADAEEGVVKWIVFDLAQKTVLVSEDSKFQKLFDAGSELKELAPTWEPVCTASPKSPPKK